MRAVAASDDALPALYAGDTPSNAMIQAVETARVEQSRLRIAVLKRNERKSGNGATPRRRRRR